MVLLFLNMFIGMSDAELMSRAAGWLAGTTAGAVLAAGAVGGVCWYLYRKFGRRCVRYLHWVPRRRARRGEKISITVNAGAPPGPGMANGAANGTSTPALELHNAVGQGVATCAGPSVPRPIGGDPDRTLGHLPGDPNNPQLPSTDSSDSGEQGLLSALGSPPSSESG